MAALDGAALFVRCPIEGCGRALQVRELRGVVPPDTYRLLMSRLKEAEAAVEADDGGALAAAGLRLRHCPGCNVRIEKNSGCDQMNCYRCGHQFNWSQARRSIHGHGAAPAPAGSAFAIGGRDHGYGGGNEEEEGEEDDEEDDEGEEVEDDDDDDDDEA